MRYEDWDVLLFPSGSAVPIREFRTQGHWLQAPTPALPLPTEPKKTPLLTCFVPALDPAAPFQVSVHAWNRPTAILGPEGAGYAPGVAYVWRIRVVVSGRVVVAETFAEEVGWPRQIGMYWIDGGRDGWALLAVRDAGCACLLACLLFRGCVCVCVCG